MVLTVKQGKRDKIHIYIDGAYQTTVDSLYFGSCGLRNGAELTQDEAAAFLQKANDRRAFNKGASLLSYQDRTRRQLVERLREDYGEEAAQTAADRLEELRLLDDARFAENYAAELLRRKKCAPRRIMQELLQKGVDRGTAEQTVAGLDFAADASILELLETKFAGKYGDEKGLRRTIAALQRLGYGYGDIRSALRQIEEEGDESLCESE